MFKGYDPNRRPPYTHVEYSTISGKVYKVTHYVSNGPAGSISITMDMERVDTNPESSEEPEKEIV